MNVLRSFRIAWKLGLRQIWQHPGRSAITLASITIGVSAVVAVTIAARATDQAMDSMFQSLTGRASLEITTESGGSMDADMIDGLSEISGVKTVSPILQRPTILSFGKNRIKLITLGIDPASYPAVHPITITQGKSLVDAKGVLLEAKLAQSIGAKPGDTVKILARRGLLRENRRIVSNRRNDGDDGRSGLVDVVAGRTIRSEIAQQDSQHSGGS